MRAALLLMTLIGVAAAPLAAGAVPAGPDKAQSASAQAIVKVDARCGDGWHWVPDGYGRKGKWRPAHCVPD